MARDHRVGDGDLLGARGGKAGGVGATQVVGLDGVVPIGLDGGIAVVGALHRKSSKQYLIFSQIRPNFEDIEIFNYLVAVYRTVDTGSEVGGLVVIEPILVDVVSIDVGSACRSQSHYTRLTNAIKMATRLTFK
jgi:hypothetical protein